jgi:hypothetical protein
MFARTFTARLGRSSQIGRLPMDNLSRACRQVWCLPNEALTMTDIGDGLFHKGQAVWVVQGDGSQRAAEYVGEGEMSAWFGGAPTVIVVYPDTHSGAAVEVDRVIPRHA